MQPRIGDRSLFFGVLLAAFALLVVLIIRPFLSYLLAALLFAFVLSPLQQRLAPRLGGRIAALSLVTVAIAGIAVSVAVLLRTLPADAAELSRIVERVFTRRRIEQRLERLLGVEVPIESVLAGAPRQFAALVVGDISNIVGVTTHAFLGSVLLLFLLYYLLEDGSQLIEWLQQMTPLQQHVQEELYTEAYVTTWAVLKGHVLVAFIQGIVAGVGLSVVGIPNVVFWTAVMMVLELFPIVGVAAILGPAVLYLGVTGRVLAAGFLLLYGLTAVAVVDDYLRAMVVDRESALHSATVLVGVFGGVYVFGVMGLFYGPIVIGFFKVLVRLYNEQYRREA